MSKGKAKSSGKRKRVLSDHDKIGKRLVPPMLRAGRVNGISLGKDIVPEFLWLALLNNYHGWKTGVELSLALARQASTICETNTAELAESSRAVPKEFFGTVTAYATLSHQQKETLVSGIKATDEYFPLTTALEPLVSLYPACPLLFLFGNKVPTPTSDAIDQLKCLIRELFDKHSKPAVWMFANAVYIALCTGRLQIHQGSQLSRFNDIEAYPKTERSRGVAAMVRATSYSLLAHTHPDWAKYFWNRGLEIEACDYDEVVRNDLRRIMEGN